MNDEQNIYENMSLKKPVYVLFFFKKLTVSVVYTPMIPDLVNQPFVVIVNIMYYTLYTVGANMLIRQFPPSGGHKTNY